jgi:TPR repeat protein
MSACILLLFILSFPLAAADVWAEPPASFAVGLDACRRGDYEVARAVWLELAEAGHVVAQYNLGVLFANGMGCETDYTQAAHWYRRAAKQGDLAACNALGVLYAVGRGVEADPVQAYVWMGRAAQEGHPCAQKNLPRLAATMSEAELERARRLAAFVQPPLQADP